MALDVELLFQDDSAANFPVVAVHRVEVRDALSELFEVVLHVASSEVAANASRLLREHVTVRFGPREVNDDNAPAGPLRLGSIQGIIRRVRQLTTVLENEADPALYEVVVVPAVWLTTRRKDRRIFQDRTVPEIVEDVLANYDRVPKPIQSVGLAPREKREYCTQYDETDLDFLQRILAEEQIATLFDHAAASVFTLMDDPSMMAPALPRPVVVAPRSGMVPTAPHVANVVPTAQVEIENVTVRDYNHERPRPPPDAQFNVMVPDESRRGYDDLKAYVYEERQFVGDGADRAERLVTAMRVPARAFTFDASFGLAPGTRLTLAGHPTHEDLNREFLAVGLEMVLDDGDKTRPRAALVDGPVRRITLECTRTDLTYYPKLRDKPRVHGTQTGFITGDGQPGTVDVDVHGRVKLELNWDRRNLHQHNPTRWTRVAQAWAGQGYGLVTLPRIGDEVVVDYIEGDPDNPIVIGRVHNAVQRTPLDLPDKDKAIAVWRSRSFGPDGLADGYNQVLMDDAAGAERLEIHAQRDFKSETGHDSVTTTGNNGSSTTTGHSTNKVGGAYSLSAGSTSVSTGAYTLTAKTIDQAGREHVKITSPASIMLTVDDASISLAPGGIILGVGGSTIIITANAIDMTSAKITIQGGVTDVRGTPIKLNSP